MKLRPHSFKKRLSQQGFTLVEALLACVVFVIIVGSMTTALNSLRGSYVLARQYNEVYTVLSACPEVDRALEFDSISSTTNCYPNNTFPAEDGGSGTITYAPALTVTDTSNLPGSDPLQGVPDSKVLDLKVSLAPPNASVAPLELRMLITRNGIGQQ